MDRLARFLGGPRLWIKRDDQTGLATGGNKARKLEFLVGDALAGGCDHLVTAGAAQSNHCRQTAAAAAHHGLRVTLVLRGEKPAGVTGNLLIDCLLGAEIRWAGTRDRAEVMREVANEVIAAGGRPYSIPVGGSNAIGACGYVPAVEELLQQLRATGETIDRIVVASATGGTQAGLVVGAALGALRTRILGVGISSDAVTLRREVLELAADVARQLRLTDLGQLESRVEVECNYLGEGYAMVGGLEREALRLVARYEGIVLDPVYSGRAMGALVDLIRRGEISADETVLFWHTGGAAALSAFAASLLEGED